MNALKNLCAKVKKCLEGRRRPQQTRQAQRRPLTLEPLEDRIIPAILFDQGVSTTVSSGSGTVLASPQVELVFWGSKWSSNLTLETNVTNAVNYLIGDSPYELGLAQYGVGLGELAATPVTITTSSPAANFTNANVQTVLQNNVGSSIAYHSNWLYMVITQPGSTDPKEGLFGEHAVTSNSSGSFDYGWTVDVGGTGALDNITYAFSHEYCEAVTDPDGTVWQVNPRNAGSWNEICDGEAQSYSFRVDNYLVQSYFSKADDAYIVPNGSTNTFLVSKTRVLTLNGYDVTVSQNGNGVYAVEDYSTAQFDPGAISSITVNGWTHGEGGIDIEATLANVPVTVNLNGTTQGITVSEGPENLSTIQGAVAVQGPGSAALDVYDAKGTAPLGSGINMTSSSLQRTSSAPISFADVTGTLDLYGGSEASVYNVNSTSSAMTTTIHVTGSATNTVKIGDSSHNLAAVSTLNVLGNGHTTVKVDDSDNLLLPLFSSVYQPVLTQYAIGGGKLTRTAAEVWSGGLPTDPPVQSPNAVINYSRLAALNVTGGPMGIYTYQVNDTYNTNSVTIKAASASDAVTVGDSSHNLAAIAAPLSVQGNGHTTVKVDDSGNLALPLFSSIYQPVLTQYAIGGGKLTRTATEVWSGGLPTDPPAQWPYAVINYSSLAALNVTGGHIGTYTYQVNDTSNTNSLALTGGSGSRNTLTGPNVTSTWQITGTNAGKLNSVVSFTGIQNLTGGSAGNDFVFSDGAGVTGAIDAGSGFGDLDYGAYTTPVTVDLSTNTATGAGSVAHIRILRGGSGDDSLTGNANDVTTFIASPGNDAVTGLPGTADYLDAIHASNTWNITGHNAGILSFAGNTTTFSGVFQLTGADVADDFVIADGASVDVINGASGISTLDESAYTTPVTVRFVSGLGAAAATGVPSVFAIQNFIGGTATNTLIGPSANTTWNVTAQNAGNLNRTVNFSGFQNLTGGSANDTVVLSDGAGVDGSIDGGAGSNTLNESAYSTAVTVDLTAGTATGVGGTITNLQNFVGAGAGGNTLNGPAGNITWSISGSNAGTATGGFSFAGFQNLSGGAGDNTFVFGAGASLGGTITGGGGTNSLDYSSFAGDVIVDLQTGLATAISGGVSGTFANVHGANSSAAGLYNLLIGAGGNVLTGGTGRPNILVAGGNASTLVGGTQDDLLIGGTTSYDTQAGLTSWQQIAAYWAGTDPFDTRVNNLLTGNGVPLLDATVVTGNGGGNTMTGAGALALLYSDGADTISGFDSNSQTVGISS